jgi:phosphoglycolate phosphatase-like HAD superfamily hydrolase
MARARILGCCNHAISLIHSRTPSQEVGVGTNPPSTTLVDPLKRNGLDSLFMRGVPCSDLR